MEYFKKYFPCSYVNWSCDVGIGWYQMFLLQYYELRYKSRHVRLLNLAVGCINYVSTSMLIDLKVFNVPIDNLSL